MQKKILIFMIVSFLFACTENSGGKQETEQEKAVKTDAPPAQKSIPSETSKRIGNTTIKILYTAPSVRGRVIWGKLVPYDKIWVTGAHNATSLEVGKDFRVGNKTIPAGKYALFTIPRQDEWTIIINKNWNQHQADEYTESDDLVRLQVKPQSNEHTERLAYEINQTGERTAEVIISWEKMRIPFSIELL